MKIRQGRAAVKPQGDKGTFFSEKRAFISPVVAGAVANVVGIRRGALSGNIRISS